VRDRALGSDRSKGGWIIEICLVSPIPNLPGQNFYFQYNEINRYQPKFMESADGLALAG
jgi:hypothetical protein